MADALYYAIGWGLVFLAGLTAWAVFTPNHLFIV